MRMDTMRLYRWARRLSVLGVPLVPNLLITAMRFMHVSHISPKTPVGEGTELGYGGVCLMVHPRTRIGRHCILAPLVSISGSSGRAGAAEIGDYVRIGIGARILGPVRIGDFAVIGANAVVTRDVPPGTVMAGVPAREVKRLDDPAGDYERSTGKIVNAAGRELARRIQQKSSDERTTTVLVADPLPNTLGPNPVGPNPVSPVGSSSVGPNVVIPGPSPFGDDVPTSVPAERVSSSVALSQTLASEVETTA